VEDDSGAVLASLALAVGRIERQVVPANAKAHVKEASLFKWLFIRFSSFLFFLILLLLYDALPCDGAICSPFLTMIRVGSLRNSHTFFFPLLMHCIGNSASRTAFFNLLIQTTKI
jgi:hypothetical protein